MILQNGLEKPTKTSENEHLDPQLIYLIAINFDSFF